MRGTLLLGICQGRGCLASTASLLGSATPVNPAHAGNRRASLITYSLAAACGCSAWVEDDGGSEKDAQGNPRLTLGIASQKGIELSPNVV